MALDPTEPSHSAPQWVSEVLWGLNAATAVLTISNVFYIRYKLPTTNRRAWKKSISIEDRTEYLQNEQQIANRKAIEKYFYFIAVTPLFVSLCSHCGAHFPHESYLIFPGMAIVVAVAYLLFMKMMVISCDGWSKIKALLVAEPDECRAYIPFYQSCAKRFLCRCFLRENAYLGLTQRMALCSMIMIKPVLNYCTAYWEYKETPFMEQAAVSYLFRALAIITTVIPLKTMESLHGALVPLTRMKRTTIKCIFVSFLGPICQIQQTVIGIAFKMWNNSEVDYMEGIEERYKWVEWYGMLLCSEMLLFAMVTIYCFNPQDLRMWEYSETLIARRSSEDIELSDLSRESAQQPAGVIVPFAYRSRVESNASLV